MTLPVTVCVPVRNEESNLASCLDALGGNFAQVVIIDSGSTDGTRQIARGRGAEIIDFHWNGRFPKKRNWALRNREFTTPWVLFLDADERVTPGFIDELHETLSASPHAGFWISFENWFMGRPLRHGDTFRKLSLFRIGAGEYEQFPEINWSYLDMEVHEHPILTGSTGTLRSRLQHCDYRGLKAYIARHNEYSSWEANRYLWLHSANAKAWSSLSRRQSFKYRFLGQAWMPCFYFLVQYVLKLGFLDGIAGLRFALFKLRYFEDIRLKILESAQSEICQKRHDLFQATSSRG